MSRTFILFASISVLSGCLSEEAQVGTESQESLSANGVSPNGTSPNGTSPNGVSPNGVSPNGTSPNGVTLNGVSPNGTSPNGTSLLAVTGTGGAPLAGTGLIGSTWTGQLSDGRALPMRIDGALRLPGKNADIWSYAVSAQHGNVRAPLCGYDAQDRPIAAIAVQGTWDMRQGVPGGGSYRAGTPEFTFACRGSAIAKCVEFGYKPWDGHEAQLASCVRALRADYCGDGTPYTVNGTIINIFDDVGLQIDDQAWIPEAEWTPSGARCISRPSATRFMRVAGVIPTCFPSALAAEASCGTGFAAGATLITELPRN